MASQAIPDTQLAAPSDIFSVVLAEDWTLSIDIATIPLAVALIIVVVIFIAWRLWASRRVLDFEIDGAEVGIGDFKMAFKPNDTDRQIAYSIWVELSTRKIGLPIDLENDVISEVYDSWYSFFGVTRELVKTIPVSKVRHDSTGKIIKLSIEVLNEGLRPHLTKWQARYIRWYEHQTKEHSEKSPQQIQADFPDYDALSTDMLSVNKKLIRYREKMNELAVGH
ncbi:MAG: hypothetical protein ABJZ83_03740 [Yoonia sp.]|uniref:hypothetical protein n=1 Tax=Yoonia sp. TaxID=2212373 RepID=UPI003299CB03